MTIVEKRQHADSIIEDLKTQIIHLEERIRGLESRNKPYQAAEYKFVLNKKEKDLEFMEEIKVLLSKTPKPKTTKKK